MRAILASLALHALAALLLGLVEPPPSVRIVAPRPIAIAVIRRPVVRAVPAVPAGPPRTRAIAPPVRRGAARALVPPASLRAAAPPAPGLMRMRPPIEERPRAPAPRVQVVVPPAWSLAGPRAAPRADELPPGALFGPPRAPRPPVPDGDATRRRLGPNVVPDGDGGYREDHITFHARVDRDGAVHFKDRPNMGMDTLLSGHFDLTDAVMRAMGDDPYAYQKVAFMERTRAAREGMAAADRSARIREAQKKLPAYLDKIWAQRKWTAVQKRLLLFALWDEAAEKGDAEIVRAGTAARRTIEAFIRRRLPAGSAAAYTAAELAELNRRRASKQRFEPYARGRE